MGVPEMEKLWFDLQNKINSHTANKDEQTLYKKLSKTIKLISIDPKYPSLNTHEIEELTKRYTMKVFQSYVENKTSNALRIYWVYGPEKSSITIIGLEPHPNDKNNAYKKVTLSNIK